MRFSYTALKTYEDCPLKYKFKHVERLPEMSGPRPDLAFGINLHNTLKDFYESLSFVAPSLENLVQMLQENWKSKGLFASREDENFHFKEAQKILIDYFNKHKNNLRPALAIERSFSLPLDKHVIYGKIDRLDKDNRNPADKIEIIDYKTSRHILTQEQVANDPQLIIYAMAVEQLYRCFPETISLYFLRNNFKVSIPFDASKVQKVKDRILENIAKIENQQFPSRSSPLCAYCGYEHLCSFQKDKFRAKGEKDEETGIDIDKVVEKYLALRDQNKDCENQLEDLKEAIHNYLDKKSLDRIYSEKAIITRRLIQRYNYDSQKVRQILEPLGLFEEVVEVKSSKIKSLFEDGIIDTETHAKVQKEKSIGSESRQIFVQKIEEAKT